ncbi:MAG: LysE family translocator [Deinococcota bacterium]
MELSTWLLFVSFATISIISPGPAVLLSVTNSLKHGLSKSLFSSLGNITGILVISSAAALGLGTILQTSALLFTFFKFAGALYLIYLGIRQWRSRVNAFTHVPGEAVLQQSHRQSFVQGLLIAVTNPKAVLFFTALFPQFINPDTAFFTQVHILTFTFMSLSLTTLAVYGLGASSARAWFSQGQRVLWFNRISGTIFVSLGLGMLRLRSKAT